MLTACAGSKDNEAEIDKLKAELAELQKAQGAGDATAVKKIRVNKLKLSAVADVYNLFQDEPDDGYEKTNEFNEKLDKFWEAVKKLSYDSTEEEIAAAESLWAELSVFPSDKKWKKSADQPGPNMTGPDNGSGEPAATGPPGPSAETSDWSGAL